MKSVYDHPQALPGCHARSIYLKTAAVGSRPAPSAMSEGPYQQQTDGFEGLYHTGAIVKFAAGISQTPSAAVCVPGGGAPPVSKTT